MRRIVKCCVIGCQSDNNLVSRGVRFERFPDIRCFPNRFAKWIVAVGASNEDVPAAQKTLRVCSLHFVEEDYGVKTERNKVRTYLKSEAVPSLRLPTDRVKIDSSPLPTYPDTTNGSEQLYVTANYGDESQTSRESVSRCSENTDFVDVNEMKMPYKKIKLEPQERHSIRSNHSEGGDEFPPGSVFEINPPESDLDFLTVNGYRYYKFNRPITEYQYWRCVVNTCNACIITSAYHHSILVGAQETHSHHPNKTPSFDVNDWTARTSCELEPASDWGGEPCRRDDRQIFQGRRPPPWLKQGYANGRNPSLPDLRFPQLTVPTFNNFAATSSTSQPSISSVPPYRLLPPMETMSTMCNVAGSQMGVNSYVSREQFCNNGQDPESPASAELQIAETDSLHDEEEGNFILHSSPGGDPLQSDDSSDRSSTRTLRMGLEEPFFVSLINVGHSIENDPLDVETEHTNSNTLKSPSLTPDLTSGSALDEEDAAFFRILAPHLLVLSKDEKNEFRREVMTILSRLTKGRTNR